MSKDFTIYTSTEDPQRVLRAPTQIVLTVTPVKQDELFKSQTPIAWRVLAFGGRSETVENVTWQSSVGFSSITVDGDNVVTAGISTHVPSRSWVQLENVAGTYQWTRAKGLDSPGDVVMARNTTGVPRTFALCSVDENWKFEPFVHFKSTQNGRDVTVGPPVMLQAYAVSGYKKGQLLSQTDSARAIFTEWEGKAQPIDLRKLGDGTSFLLYSDNTGRLKLEKQ